MTRTLEQTADGDVVNAQQQPQPPHEPPHRRLAQRADAPGARPCRAVAACIFEYLDGELGPALATEVAAHLAACGRCRERVASDRALLAVIARAARAVDDAAPPSLRARLHRALTRAELDRVSARRRV
jgi:mycothiol system anti-sigma-R factor